MGRKAGWLWGEIVVAGEPGTRCGCGGRELWLESWAHNVAKSHACVS